MRNYRDELEPLVVRRREESFHIRFSLSRERAVEEDKIKLSHNGIWPFAHLLLQDLTACAESMKAEEPGLLLLVTLFHGSKMK